MAPKKLPKRTRAAQAEGREMKDEDEKREMKDGDEKREVKDGDEKGEMKDGDEKKNAVDCTQHWEDEVHMEDGKKEYVKFKEQEARAEKADGAEEVEKTGEEENEGSDVRQEHSEEEATAKKRGAGANQKGGSKKQKGSANGEPDGKAGDKTRVPAKGQKVQWKGLAGVVDGQVVEVVFEEKRVEGKSVKGSKEDPRLVLKSRASGKIAVHKPEAVYF
ncbi:hypothetical protein K504DRAFT_460834, partial [Pleomassaria siparia CBS 279.74]